MNKIVALIVLLASCNSHAAGGKKPCDIINELPWCTKQYKLNVVNGEGSGKFPPNTEVKIKAVAPKPNQEFTGWSDPSGVVKDPKDPNGLVITLDKESTVTALFKDPPNPCDVDPASCEPKPTGQTIRASFLEKDAAISSLCFMADTYNDDEKREMIRRHKDQGLNEMWIYAANEDDFRKSCQFQYSSDKRAHWRNWLSKLNADGLTPRIWLFADDSPGMAKWSTDKVKQFYKLVHDDLGDLVGGYVTGLEVNEYWDKAKHKELLVYLNSIVGNKTIGVHTGSIGSIDYALHDEADYYFLQYGFGQSESKITSLTKDAIAKKGKCKVVGAEYHKSGSVSLGDAAIKAGAIGCGNNCLIKERPKCDGDEPTPGDFDWSKVKKYGGPEIGIASDIAQWPVTRKFTLKGTGGMMLTSSIDGKAYEPAIDGLSGNFNACVQGSDGLYTCGSWDYCRASYQTSKTLKNLSPGGEMAKSFGLSKGSKICFFYSGMARSSKRNVKERSDLVCTEWAY